VCLAIPAQIVSFRDPERFLAEVDVAGVRRVVNVALVSGGEEGAGVGDWVLIHVGFALAKIDEWEAAATRRVLEQMGAEYHQELEEFKRSSIE
jgi:hydrogenase expression/formation protein HypC